MAEGKKNRPSLQLLIDRKLAMWFRAFCLEHDTSASAVVTAWIESLKRTKELPPLPTKTPPKRNRKGK